MKIKTEHKIAQVYWDQPLSRNWRAHDLAAILVGYVRTLRSIFESWLLISCMKMSFFEFPCSYMRQAKLFMARSQGGLADRLVLCLFCCLYVLNQPSVAFCSVWCLLGGFLLLLVFVLIPCSWLVQVEDDLPHSSNDQQV